MDKKTGLMFVFFTAIVSGFSIFINKFGVAESDAYVFTFLKNIIVSLFLFSLILIFKEFSTIKNLTKKQLAKLVLIGFFGGSVPFLLFFKGLKIASAANASFIHKTMFIFVGLLALIFLKDKLDKKIMIPAVLLLIGNFLLLKINNFSFGYGELLVFIAVVFWAIETIISKNVLKDLEPRIVAFSRMFIGSFFILAFLVFTDKVGMLASINISQILWILLTSVFLFLYVFTWYNGLKYVNATLATSVLLLGSPITTALNLIFLETTITLSQAFGMLLITAGVISMIYLLTIKEKNYSAFSTANPK